MFEHFTEAAREVVVGAQQEARTLGNGWIGTEHLLLAALADPAAPLGRALERLGLSQDAVRAQVCREVGAGTDAGSALRDLGIDLDDVRRRVEERFVPGALDQPVPPARRRLLGRLVRRSRSRPCTERRADGGRSGHIPFTPLAKKSLELALREALRLHMKEIRVEHLVLGLMRTEGLAAGVVTRLGVPPDDVRRAVLDQLGRAA